MNSTAINIENISRSFGEVKAVKDLELKVNKGEIFGFLGPNGAGKTTTIRLILNFIKADSGDIEIFGSRLKWGDYLYHRQIGYLPGEISFPINMTGGRLLDYWQSLDNREQSHRNECMEVLSFSGKDLHRKISDYSRGMKQKLGIIGAMQTNPDLLILDEPTGGLDPLVKHSFLEYLGELRYRGTTIFFSSHILSEIETAADTAAIIRHGELVTSASIVELKKHGRKKVTVLFSNEKSAAEFCANKLRNPKRKGALVEFQLDYNINKLFEVLSKYEVEDLSLENPTLEEIFLNYYENADD